MKKEFLYILGVVVVFALLQKQIEKNKAEDYARGK